MRRSSLLALTMVALQLCGVLVLGQQPAPQPTQSAPQQRDDPPQKIGVLEKRLPITVKKDKRFVGGLTASNFEVYEDGNRQEILKFIAPSQLPLNIAVLMDTSNSVKLKLPFEKDAAEDFVATVTTFR